MAAGTFLFYACVAYVIATSSAMDPCPSECFCVAFETDCSKRELAMLPMESEIREGTEYFHMNGNQLDNVARIDLPRLREYYLQDNLIENVMDDAFISMPELVFLNLSRNMISDLQKAEFQPLLKLETLDLSYNMLSRIEDSIFNGIFLQSLDTLDLSYNDIESLAKDSFTSLKKLINLRLNNNKIKTIQHHPFHGVPSLMYLYLHNNHLQTIEDKNFYPMESLVTLTLNNNKLTRVQKMALYNLKSVENLDISNNMMEDLPREAMDDLLSLSTLNMGGNPIQELAKRDFPSTLNRLVSLALSNMPMLRIIAEASFDNLPNLKKVNISNNPLLTEIPPTLFFKSFHKLRNVDLSYNGLSSLDREMLPWDLLFTLSVTGNKWRCDCNCVWMKNYTFENDIQCALPPNLAGRMMDDTPAFEFICPKDGADSSSSRSLRIGLAASALTVSLLIIIGLLYKVRRRFPCFKSPLKYISLYNIYDPHKDSEDLVVTFRGDKVETKSTGVELEKDML